MQRLSVRRKRTLNHNVFNRLYNEIEVSELDSFSCANSLLFHKQTNLEMDVERREGGLGEMGKSAGKMLLLLQTEKWRTRIKKQKYVAFSVGERARIKKESSRNGRIIGKSIREGRCAAVQW